MVQHSTTWTRLLGGIALLVFVCQCNFILHQSWSPIDEYPHMDYIQKLSYGHLPSNSDSIDEATIVDMQLHPSRHPVIKFTSRQELGLANYSYQAKHPPFYYLLFSVPNRVLESAGMPIFQRVLVFRICSFLLFTVGLLCMFPIATQLKKLGYLVSKIYIWLFVIFSLFIATHERYGLGNNMLSPLLLSLSFYFLLKFKNESKHIFLFFGFFFLALSLVTALTNIFLLPLFFVFILWVLRSKIGVKIILLFLSACLFPLLLLYIWHRHPETNQEVANNISNLIHQYFRANQIDFWTFLTFFGNDTATIDWIHKGLNLRNYFGGLIVLNAVASIFVLRELSQKENRWILFSYGIVLYFVVLLFLLNRYVDDVTWVAFRHYLGWLPFLFIACTASLFLLGKKCLQFRRP